MNKVFIKRNIITIIISLIVLEYVSELRGVSQSFIKKTLLFDVTSQSEDTSPASSPFFHLTSTFNHPVDSEFQSNYEETMEGYFMV